MKKILRLDTIYELLISVGVLAIILYYSFVFIYLLPYNGLRFRGDNGAVFQVYTRNLGSSPIVPGDTIIKVNDMTWEEFSLKEKVLDVSFRKHLPGDRLLLTIQRAGQSFVVDWVFPPMNHWEVLQRTLFEPWILLPLGLWLCGFVTLLIARPRDKRRNLMTTLYYLSAVWTLTVSMWDIHYSGVLFVLSSWMLVPVTWHFHWVFPRIIRELNPWIWLTIYLSALAGAVITLSIQPDAYPQPILLITVFFGAIILLAIHYVRQPELRRQILILLVGFLIATLPGLIFLATRTLTYYPVSIRVMAYLFLLALPATHFYVLFYHRMGSLELRANSFISLLFLGIVIFLINYILIHFLFLLREQLLTPLTSILLASLVTAILTAVFYPRLHSWFEQQILGIPVPKIKLLTTYAGKVITAHDQERLVEIITAQIFPSLLIRQAALLRVQVSETDNKPVSIEPILRFNLGETQVPQLEELARLISIAGQFIPTDEPQTDRLSWVRLVLLKQAEPNWLVLWLFGRRDPDDYYSQSELPTFQALVDNTTLSLLNITQNRLLHDLYQNDIIRKEHEYHRLALDLHDDVLNQLALLAQTVDDSQASPEFIEAYQTSVQRIREIISGLRPPLLNFGLRAALDGLIDEFAALMSQEIFLVIDIPPSSTRYPLEVELQTYRIVQQACLNAIQHSQAEQILVQGDFRPNQIELTIQDNGVGLEHSGILNLDWLIATKHFGLAGMFERAELIGAKISLNSLPGEGATIRLTWNGHGSNQAMVFWASGSPSPEP